MRYITVASVFIILGILVNTISRWIPGIDGNVFCQLQALSFLIWAIGARYTDRTNNLDRILWDYAIGLALNNAYDEIKGNPFEVGKIEITVTILITLCTVYRLREWRIKMTS